jgi:hypothetical protein
MARISYTSEISELVGKLAGSVFQYSYGGFQVHTRVVPQNPQTNQQQLRRGWFGWFAESWRDLDAAEQLSFVSEAGSVPEGFRLYLQSNINSFLIDQPAITTYAAATAPVSMAMDIDLLSPGNFDIIASGSPSTVPADTKLLILATAEKVLPKRFTNPSDYSPIVYFDEGTDMSSATSILTAWQNLYGILSGTKRICINSVLIDKNNGNRSADSIICQPPITTTTFRIIDDTGDILIDSDGTFVVSQ